MLGSLSIFAGHGHTTTLPDGRSVGYIVPTDAPLPANDDPRGNREFRRTAFSMEYFGVLAHIMEAKHALFIFDSCFAGTIFGHLYRGPVPDYTTADLTKPVRYFISSGDKDQQVPDKSIFRQHFVKALQNGNADETELRTGQCNSEML